jgi:hypothetical protein
VRQSKRLFIVLDVLFLSLLMVYAFAGRDGVPFHGDEASLIAGMVDYFTIFHDGDLAWAKYEDPGEGWHRDFQLLRLTTGSIHLFTMGIAFDLAGVTADQLNGEWEWSSDTDQIATIEYNQVRGNVPGDRLLSIARTPSAILVALSVLLVFAIAWRLTRSRLAAYAASLIYATTPSVLVNGRRAMQEGGMLFFLCLTVFLAVCAIQAQAGRRGSALLPLGWYAALGAAGGLAVASKHPSLVVFLAALLAVLIAPLTRRKQAAGEVTPFDWRHVCALAGAGLLSVAVFFLVTPIWWSWTRVVLLGGLAGLLLALAWERGGRIAWLLRGAAVALVLAVTAIHPQVWPELAEPPSVMIEWRVWLMDIQAGPDGGMQDLDERTDYLVEQVLFAPGEYYEAYDWAVFGRIAQERTEYESSGLDGRSGGFAWGVALAMLLALGLEALAEGRRAVAVLVLALWLGVPALVLLATNTLPWQRYYLALYAPLAVLCGLGVRQVGTVVKRLRSRVGS